MSAFKLLKGAFLLMALVAFLAPVAGGASRPSAISELPVTTTLETVTGPVTGAIPGPADDQGVDATVDAAQEAITTVAAGAGEVTTAVEGVTGPTPLDETAEEVTEIVTPVEEDVEQTVEETVAPVLGTPVPEVPTNVVPPAPTDTTDPAPAVPAVPGQSAPAAPAVPSAPAAPATPTPGVPSGQTPVLPGTSLSPTSPTATPSTDTPTRATAPAEQAPALAPVGSVAKAPRPEGLFPAFGDAFAEFTAAVPDWAWPIILALIALTLVASARSYVEGKRRRRAVSERQQAAEDLLLLQSMLLPSLPRELGSLGVSAAYQPADGLASGGDFYDVFLTPDGRVAALLGDVSGHGRDAVTRATLARYTMRAFLMDGAGPGAALAAADRGLTQDLDLDSFVTAIIASYDPESGVLTYAQAGHHPPLFTGVEDYDPESGSSGPPLGASLAQVWPERTVALPPGAKLCLFTDGVIEARSGGKLFGRERLAQLFGEAVDGEGLLERVKADSDLVADDLAVLILSTPQAAVSKPRDVLGLAASSSN